MTATKTATQLATTATTWTVTVGEAAAIAEKVVKLQKRIVKVGLTGSVTSQVGQVWMNEDPRSDQFGEMLCELTITQVADIALPGEWFAVAAVDFTAADEPLIFEFSDEFPVKGEPDPTRCDHCKKTVARNKVMIVEDADGAQLQVGSTCVKDFLGADAMRLFILGTSNGVDVEEARAALRDAAVPTLAFVTAAATAIRAFGWCPSNGDQPTKAVAAGLLRGDAKIVREVAEALAATGGEAFNPVQKAREAIAAAAAKEAKSSFDENMGRIARSEWLGLKGFGTAAFMTEGFDRDAGKVAEWKAQAEAEAARKADAQPMPIGRTVITGVVIRTRVVESQFGSTLKMTIISADGWKANGSVPKAITGSYNWDTDTETLGVQEGDTVQFTGALETADWSDDLDGVWKRPSKATIVTRAETTE